MATKRTTVRFLSASDRLTSDSANDVKAKVFRPYLVKDRVVTRIYGLVSIALIIPLLFLFIYIYTNYVERAPVLPESTTALFWIGAGSSLLVLFPVLYAISSLKRSRILLTDKEIVVINGYRKKTLRTEQIRKIAYASFAKGVLVPTRPSTIMPYEAGVITYEEDGRLHKLELPMGWYYLQDLVKELKTSLGERLAVDEESFSLWQKWYQTPLLGRTGRVLLVIAILVLWFLPPTLLLIWITGRFNLHPSDLEVWFFSAVGIVIYTWLLLLLIRVVDAVQKKLKGKRMAS